MDGTVSRVDLPPEPGVDHALGEPTADITLIEYGSFRCPFCHAAHDVLGNLRDRFGARLRYVFRHRPLAGDALARQASELAEFIHQTTGEYWTAHDIMMKKGPALAPADLTALAQRLGLPPHADASTEQAWRRARAKVERDIASGRRSGAHVSPTFYINGRRYEGAWDENMLAEAMLGSLGHRLQSAALDFARWAPSAGLLLLVMTLLAIAAVNLPLGAAYEALWRQPVGLQIGSTAFHMPLHDWINDGLLTIFFLVVGLEIKRELTVGRLASRRLAALPAAAAVGGMLVPASIYLLLAPPAFAHGWAIPTTTDTAFAIAVIALLGHRVPVELRIFLTAAVIVDDLVAIVLVAVFYSGHIDGTYVAGALLVTVLLALLNRSGIYRPLPYALLGIVLWACLHAAGLHPTLAGVVVAVVTPTHPPPNLRALMAQAETVLHHEIASARERVLRHGVSEPALRALDAIHDRIESPADKLLRTVEPWSSYLVLPLFALANGALDVSVDVIAGHERLILAIALGLVLGKPLGMMLAAILAARAGVAVKPETYTWRQLAGAGALAGIGFTMSLYIAGKAFPDEADFAAAKFGVFLASLVAIVAGGRLLGRIGARGAKVSVD